MASSLSPVITRWSEDKGKASRMEKGHRTNKRGDRRATKKQSANPWRVLRKQSSIGKTDGTARNLQEGSIRVTTKKFPRLQRQSPPPADSRQKESSGLNGSAKSSNNFSHKNEKKRQFLQQKEIPNKEKVENDPKGLNTRLRKLNKKELKNWINKANLKELREIEGKKLEITVVIKK